MCPGGDCHSGQRTVHSPCDGLDLRVAAGHVTLRAQLQRQAARGQVPRPARSHFGTGLQKVRTSRFISEGLT